MIRYEWRERITPAEAEELRDVLARAAVYDAEPEYNTVEFDEVERSMAAGDDSVRHLIIWMLPRPKALDEPPEPERVAGIIRLVEGRDGYAEGTAVIDPELRSIGIMTLLIEQVGLDPSGGEGWLGSGLHRIRGWARGNHPASGRVTDRNLIPRTRQMWKLIRPCGAADTGSLASVDPQLSPAVRRFLAESEDRIAGQARARIEQDLNRIESGGGQDSQRPLLALVVGDDIGGLVGIDTAPVISEEFGKSGTVRYLAARGDTRDELRELLVGASPMIREVGLEALIIHVDSNSDDLVAACRLSGFQHDRTDVLYELSG